MKTSFNPSLKREVVMLEEIIALRCAYQASTKGDWYCEASLANPFVSMTEDGLRSVVARLDEHSLCPEHGGSALGNALFVARAHSMMPFLLECVAIAQDAASGASPESLQVRAVGLFALQSESCEVAS